MNSSNCDCRLTEPKILAVILDLDGTLLDTESYTKGVLKEFLVKYGKEVDREREEKKRLGMTQKESAAAIVEDYDLPLTPDQFIKEITPMYREKWLRARALPGADRLIKHLHTTGVPFALASNSLREYIDAKISHQQGWSECFSVILGSDQVKSGKPSPDLFIEAARRMGVDATRCLVIEDSLVGVKAAKAANMKVVAVPSRSEADCSFLADVLLHSLLDFQPERWDLPPFEDWAGNALPIEPIYLSSLHGTISGYDATEDGDSLPDQVKGVYFGWAATNLHEILKVVVCIGLDDCSYSAKRKIQTCAVDEDNEHIYDQKLRLLLVGYVRGSSGKVHGTSFMDAKILEENKSIARASLDLPMFMDQCSCGSYLLLKEEK